VERKQRRQGSGPDRRLLRDSNKEIGGEKLPEMENVTGLQLLSKASKCAALAA
jgi:hypothetical protein